MKYCKCCAVENAVSMHIQEPVRNVWVWDEKIATRFLNCDPFFLSSCSTYAHPYMGEHLSPSGGRDLENFLRGESKEPKSHLLQGGEPKKLTKFRGGIQRNCHFFQILGGEFFG